MIAQPQLKIDMRHAVEAILLRIARSQWCRECDCLVEMVTAGEAANLTNTSTRSIYRAAELERVHYLTIPDGSLLICRNSLQLSEAVTEELCVRNLVR